MELSSISSTLCRMYLKSLILKLYYSMHIMHTTRS